MSTQISTHAPLPAAPSPPLGCTIALEDIGVKLTLLDLALHGLFHHQNPGGDLAANNEVWNEQFRPVVELLFEIQADVEAVYQTAIGKVPTPRLVEAA